MKGKILFVLVFVIGVSLCEGQQFRWLKSSNTGDCQGSDHITVTDDNGNTYFTGTTSLGNPGVEKFDSVGDTVWSNFSCQFTHGLAMSIATYQHGEYITGYFSNYLLTPTDTLTTTTAYTNFGFFLIKFSEGGKFQWARVSHVVGLYSTSGGNSVATDNLGNAYITGGFTDTVAFGNDTLRGPSRNVTQTFIVKYDSNGNLLWLNTSGVNSDGLATSIASDKLRNIYVAGSAQKSPFNFGNDTIRGNTFPMFFLAKFRTNGTPVWIKTIKTDSNGCMANSIAADSAGNIYVAGQAVGVCKFTIGKDTLVSPKSFYPDAAFIARFDSAGNARWGKICTGYDSAVWWYWGGSGQVAADKYKNCYFIPHWVPKNDSIKKCIIKIGTDSLSYNMSYPYVGAGAAIIFQIDSAGVIMCHDFYSEGIEDDDDGFSVSPMGKYAFLIGDLDGSTYVLKSDTSYFSDGPVYGFIARWQPCSGVDDAAPQLRNEINEVTVLPNPSNGEFTIQLSVVSRQSSVEIYNMLGERVKSEELKAKSEKIDLINQPNGVYFYRIISGDGKVSGSGKLVIQK